MAKLLSGTRIYGTATIDTQVLVNGSIGASSTNSGSLQVIGGAGIGGGLVVGGIVTATTFVGAFSGTVTKATAIAGGTAGQLPYQSAVDTTSFINTATTGNFLQANYVGAPTWTTTANIYVANASVSTNVRAGTAGQLPYQSAVDTTSFINTATTGNFLQANYVGAPTWTTTANIYVANASVSTNVRAGTAGQIVYQSGADTTAFIGTATTGNFLQANYVGTPTWTTTANIYVANASVSTNIRGGAAGSIPYQSAADTTALLALGTNGYVLTAGASAPQWSAITGLTAGNATTATNLAGGNAYQIPYQTAPGTTAFANSGTTGQFWQATTNGAPTWTTTANIYVANASVSTNVRAGTAGQLHYQSAVDTTGFISTATTGNFLQANYVGAPTWTGTASIYVNRATVADATQAAATFNNSNSGAASGTTFNGSTAVTISANTLGALSLSGGGTVSGAVTFSGPVTFSSSATYALSTNTYYTDNIIELHVPPSGVSSPWFVDDGKDIGFRFHYYTASTDTNAALVLANDTKYLEWYSSGAEGTSTFVGSAYGTFKTGQILLTSSTAATSTATGAFQVTNGGIGIGGAGYFGGAIYSGGVKVVTTNTSDTVFITNSTAASSTASGALRVIGGVGIGGSLYAGNIYANGTQVIPLNIQEFTATAGQTTFTVSGGYTVGTVQVTANGISLGSGDFTASNGTTVVTTIARNVGDIIRIISGGTSSSVNNIQNFSVAMSIAMGM